MIEEILNDFDIKNKYEIKLRCFSEKQKKYIEILINKNTTLINEDIYIIEHIHYINEDMFEKDNDKDKFQIYVQNFFHLFLNSNNINYIMSHSDKINNIIEEYKKKIKISDDKKNINNYVFLYKIKETFIYKIYPLLNDIAFIENSIENQKNVLEYILPDKYADKMGYHQIHEFLPNYIYTTNTKNILDLFLKKWKKYNILDIIKEYINIQKYNEFLISFAIDKNVNIDDDILKKINEYSGYIIDFYLKCFDWDKKIYELNFFDKNKIWNNKLFNFISIIQKITSIISNENNTKFINLVNMFNLLNNNNNNNKIEKKIVINTNTNSIQKKYKTIIKEKEDIFYNKFIYNCTYTKKIIFEIFNNYNLDLNIYCFTFQNKLNEYLNNIDYYNCINKIKKNITNFWEIFFQLNIYIFSNDILKKMEDFYNYVEPIDIADFYYKKSNKQKYLENNNRLEYYKKIEEYFFLINYNFKKNKIKINSTNTIK